MGACEGSGKEEELQSVMYHLAESLRISAVLLQPFLTKTPEKMFERLGITDEALKAWDSITAFGQLKDTKVQKASLCSLV